MWNLVSIKFLKREECGLMEHQDKTILCKDCGKEFVFTAGEQSFYAEKGFENEPARCPECRSNRKRERSVGFRGARSLFEVTCASCGVSTRVPFEPREGRPVYCRDCYDKSSVRAM